MTLRNVNKTQKAKKGKEESPSETYGITQRAILIIGKCFDLTSWGEVFKREVTDLIRAVTLKAQDGIEHSSLVAQVVEFEKSEIGERYMTETPPTTVTEAVMRLLPLLTAKEERAVTRQYLCRGCGQCHLVEEEFLKTSQTDWILGNDRQKCPQCNINARQIPLTAKETDPWRQVLIVADRDKEEKKEAVPMVSKTELETPKQQQVITEVQLQYWEEEGGWMMTTNDRIFGIASRREVTSRCNPPSLVIFTNNIASEEENTEQVEKGEEIQERRF